MKLIGIIIVACYFHGVKVYMPVQDSRRMYRQAAVAGAFSMDGGRCKMVAGRLKEPLPPLPQAANPHPSACRKPAQKIEI